MSTPDIRFGWLKIYEFKHPKVIWEVVFLQEQT